MDSATAAASFQPGSAGVAEPRSTALPEGVREGNENLVQLTAPAGGKVAALIAREKQGEFLRIAISGGGCNGLSYKMKFVPEPRRGDILVRTAGVPVLVLAPLVQVLPPTATAGDAMFVYAGRDDRGARMSAAPLGFELHDPAVLDWLRGQMDLSGEDPQALDGAVTTPYRGLQAFTADDAEMFFGRDRVIDAGVNHLLVEPFLAVVGPSGAGKSSYVQAGLLPALAEWRALIARPGPAPLETLSPSTTQSLAAIVHGCLAKAPTERPSMQALAEALEKESAGVKCLDVARALLAEAPARKETGIVAGAEVTREERRGRAADEER